MRVMTLNLEANDVGVLRDVVLGHLAACRCGEGAAGAAREACPVAAREACPVCVALGSIADDLDGLLRRAAVRRPTSAGAPLSPAVERGVGAAHPGAHHPSPALLRLLPLGPVEP